jgi:hypothetical protein
MLTDRGGLHRHSLSRDSPSSIRAILNAPAFCPIFIWHLRIAWITLLFAMRL